jgi:cytochrome d ubiquinol oxidase subunit II
MAGAWMDNYARQPLTILVPVVGFAGAFFGLFFSWIRRPVAAFWSSALSQLGIIGTAGVSMFPFIMPSSTDPNSSLTVWDSVSSHLTLEVMFWAAVIFTPIVVSYTAWCYKVMSGKVTTQYVEANDRSAY